MERESQAIDLENAQSVRAELRMGAGELNVTGDSDVTLDVDVRGGVGQINLEVV
jgi:hypothetical protein